MKRHHRLLMAAILLFTACTTGNKVFAQRFFNNPVSQYYRNGFLWNPAFAGKEGTRFYGLLNKSWNGFEGAPEQISLSADMRFAEKMGAGLQVTSDKSGIFQRYSGTLSYAYALEFSESSSLRLGGSLNFYNERLDGEALIYEGQLDPTGKALNESAINFDGDFGAVFESKGFSFGGTAYNLGAWSQSQNERSADLAIAQLMGSYRFDLENERVHIKPLLAYKMFYDHTNIFTAATQVEYDGAFHAGIYWQSTGNIMGGVGLMLKEAAEVNFFYSGRNKYQVNQQYEVGLKYTIR